MAESTKPLRCAIYTRKSTEDGLEQAFNTLDAQRSACEAYILSQAGEGWTCVPGRYDDGGWSGSNMDRPALKALLRDIGLGRIDVVVVYKVDRLTRSLMDFSRIVESFDAKAVSFVSVTQAFNTTSSMGRLTLNVLLSFAQFERDVTGERIRDKIAASKARGMWMGGNIPLGYDVADRKLVIVAQEADCVRSIFTRYLDLGSVVSLARELNGKSIRTKSWISNKGRVHGGAPFSCGALYYILANRLYVGDIVHKGQTHKGEHEAIVSQDLFNAVAAQLQRQRVKCRKVSVKTTSSPLTGKLFDTAGHAMRPSFSYGRRSRAYRYYVSEACLPSGIVQTKRSDKGERVSAAKLEQILVTALHPLLPSNAEPPSLFAAIERIRLGPDHVRVRLSLANLLAQDDLATDILSKAKGIDPKACCEDGELIITLHNPAMRCGKSIGAPEHASPVHAIATQEHRKQLAKLVRTSHALLTKLNASPLQTERHRDMRTPINVWGKQRLAIGLLAPDIQKLLLQGKGPAHLTADILLNQDLPLDWAAQRTELGFAKASA